MVGHNGGFGNRDCRCLLVWAACLAACGQPIEIKTGPAANPLPATCSDRRSGTDFRVVTFNVGLAPGVVRSSLARQSEVAGSVAWEMSRTDLMCLQEVWTDGARRAVIEAVGLPPENILWSDTRGLGEDSRDRCRPWRIAGLRRCVRRNCSGKTPEDTGICGLKECFSHLVWLHVFDRHCLDCLTANIGQSEAAIGHNCTEGPGGSRAYGGRNGVILLSRYPLHRTETVILPASGSNRVALMATVEGPFGTGIEVACTHISSEVKGVRPLDSGFRTWEDEQAAQIRLVSDRLAVRSGGRSAEMLIGDMNFSRENGPIRPEMAVSWGLVSRLGFVSPASQAGPPLCSLCSGNILNPTKRPRLVDHVLIRQPADGRLAHPTCSEQVLNYPVTVPDRFGQPVVTGLSDHYGIAVQFQISIP